MKNIDEMKTELFEKVTAGFENESDYCEATAKVFRACDIIDAMPVWRVAEILGLDAEDEEEERLAARVKDLFLIGCDKWLAA